MQAARTDFSASMFCGIGLFLGADPSLKSLFLALAWYASDMVVLLAPSGVRCLVSRYSTA